MGKSEPTVTDLLPPIEEVPAAHMVGRTLANGWTVTERIQRDPGGSGGYFSVPYFVEGLDGRHAFLKVLNVAAVLGSSNGPVLERLKAFADAYVYELDLLQQCRERRMSRIVHLLDYGELDIPEAGVLRQVPYLVFELADGDIRDHQARLQNFDLAWVLQTLKHATQGVEQLHAAHAAHQDLKPSNILTQDGGREVKLGDLGRAERRGMRGPHSDRPIPGAVSYAPPEQLYGTFARTWEERRAADLYQLGSLAVHLFLGHNITALMQQALPLQIRWQRWHGDFAGVLPYIRTAHADVLGEFEGVVLARTGHEHMTADLVRAVREMTDPDPLRRGHPRDRSAKTSSYAVRRYVSLFNRLAAEARVALLGGISRGATTG